ncbi:MgtC/SapB transporter [Geobacter metallireducens RCH3]|nr:MgtC/SapB transporter [Geobacter metallireducens RCH3]
MMEFNLYMIGRLLLASLLGGLIGLEREIHGRPAGFRTHLLVSLGSCLFVVASIEFYRLYGNFSGVGPLGVDPGRVAAQVVTGIGFLGAGAILREGSSIRGLTTAACLWIAAAIGLSCGAGLYTVSLAVTAISLITLLCLKRVESVLKRDSYYSVKVWSDDMRGLSDRIEQVLKAGGLEILDVNVEKDIDSARMYFEFDVKFSTRGAKGAIVESLVSVDGVRKVRLD